MKDLFVLVADIEIRNMVESLFRRMIERQFTRPFTFDLRAEGRDAGCFKLGPEYLKASQKGYRRFMIVFDKDGSGKETWETEKIVSDVIKRASQNGLEAQDLACVVLVPELESWVWTDTKHTANAMGWDNLSSLKDWLVRSPQNHRFAPNGKPLDPKAAVKLAIKEAQKKNPKIRFSEVHGTVALNASLERCTDPSFLHFKETLLRWFPPVD